MLTREEKTMEREEASLRQFHNFLEISSAISLAISQLLGIENLIEKLGNLETRQLGNPDTLSLNDGSATKAMIDVIRGEEPEESAPRQKQLLVANSKKFLESAANSKKPARGRLKALVRAQVHLFQCIFCVKKRSSKNILCVK